MARPPTIDAPGKPRTPRVDPRIARRASRRPRGDDPFAFYRAVAGYPLLGTYRAKFTAVVAGTVALSTFVLVLAILFGAGRINVGLMLALVLALAAATTAAIVWAVDRLLRPLQLASRALDALSDNVDLPRMALPGTDEAAQILRGVQSVIGRLHQQEDATRAASDRDDLTGLWQRRAGRARAQALVESHTRQGRAVRVVVADVAGMRVFNARFGAGQGDALLKSLAARLSGIAGDDGVAARWCGDRFLLVLPVADERGPSLGELLGRPFVFKGSDEPVHLAWSDVTVDAPVAVDGPIAQAEAQLASIAR